MLYFFLRHDELELFAKKKRKEKKCIWYLTFANHLCLIVNRRACDNHVLLSFGRKLHFKDIHMCSRERHGNENSGFNSKTSKKKKILTYERTLPNITQAFCNRPVMSEQCHSKQLHHGRLCLNDKKPSLQQIVEARNVVYSMHLNMPLYV